MDNVFGKRLKDLRDEHELTMDFVVYDMQRKFEIEINKSQLSRWERGQSPSLHYLKYLAMYYNVSADYLLGITDSKKPSAKINTLVALLNQEHKSTDVGEVADIIDKAITKSEEKAAKKAEKESQNLFSRLKGAEI